MKMQHYLRFMAKLLQYLHDLPLDKQLEPVPDVNALKGFSYEDLREISGESFSLVPVLLEKLEEYGMVNGELADRILLCPHCLAYNICFRDKCPECHSPDLVVTQMIHHFRCGYVGQEQEFFSHGNVLVCPKCSYKLAHVGKDYEKPSEVFLCNPCGWSGSEAETLGLCIACRKEVNPDVCVIHDIKRYRISQEGQLAVRSGNIEEFLIGAAEKPDAPLADFKSLKALKVLCTELGRIAVRYKTPLLIMNLRPDALASLDHDVLANIAEPFIDTLEEKIRGMLRESDYVSSDSDYSLFLVLPETAIEGGEVLAKRICDEVAATVFSGPIRQTSVSIGMVAWHDQNVVDAIFEQCRILRETALEQGGNRWVRG
jgi:hypothetical protein